MAILTDRQKEILWEIYQGNQNHSGVGLNDVGRDGISNMKNIKGLIDKGLITFYTLTEKGKKRHLEKVLIVKLKECYEHITGNPMPEKMEREIIKIEIASIEEAIDEIDTKTNRIYRKNWHRQAK